MNYLEIFMTLPELGDSITITGDVGDLDFITRTTDCDDNFLYLVIMISILDTMANAKWGHSYLNLDSESKELFVSHSKAHDYISALKLLNDSGCLLDDIEGQIGDDELDGFNNELIGLDGSQLKVLYDKAYQKVLDFATNKFPFYLPAEGDYVIHSVESVTINGNLIDHTCLQGVAFIQLMIWNSCLNCLQIIQNEI